MSFNVNYNAGGSIDKVKKLDSVDDIHNISNLENLDNLKQVDNISVVQEIGKIKNFATMSQPFNIMEKFDIPALDGDYEFEMILPERECEILAISLTCSGYGEDDHYDLFFNGKMWFRDWYCSEVKEGLFIGTSTYVYSAPAGSKIKLVFKNDSGTSKVVYFGVRMLVSS